MADLVARMPCDGLLPVEAGAVRLNEEAPGWITSLMPVKGAQKDADAALRAAHGMGFPKPGRTTGRDGARVVWTGAGQAMLIGPEPDARLAGVCALSDQSDAWAVMRLEGVGARNVLARLSPLDLRPTSFKRGHTARSLLGHMNASITRTGPETWLILVYRSMAQTAVHELEEAMTRVAQRGPARDQAPRHTV